MLTLETQIGLPLDYKKVPTLCVLEPFLAGNRLIVTPCVGSHDVNVLH